MVFDNMEFHNVEEMEKCDKGYIMWRVPGKLRPLLCQVAAQRAARYGTGVEIRFRIKGDKAVIKLRTEPMEEAQTAYIYYGSFQGGWTNSSRVILEQETDIVIARPHRVEELEEIAARSKTGFDPKLVRLVLPSGLLYYIGAEGEVEPPSAGQTPKKTYLAYGSSITHGSLGLASPFAYPFLLSRRLCCDYINMGFAGTARLETEMAEYLCGRRDWDFASLELGVNLLGDAFSEAFFEERVRRFTEIFARDARPVFVTDIFGHINKECQEKSARFREIVQRLTAGKLIYTNGLQLLNQPAFISQDMTHPSWEGQFAIAENWERVMREHLNLQ